jgi:hypothetical protein
MAEKFNMQSQMEHLQMKYVGTGHADITKLYVSFPCYVLPFLLWPIRSSRLTPHSRPCPFHLSFRHVQ